jgi:flagellar protein FlaF
MFGSARQAYDTASRASVSSRELEARALFKAARQLEECANAWEAPDLAIRLDHALRFNQRLWTIFQSELLGTEHPMPAELRVNLLRISAFVDRRTFEVMAEPHPDKLRSLIDLNRQIAAGLSVQPA